MMLAAAMSLLVLVDDTFANHFKLAGWRQLVERESNFVLVAWDVVPRCTALEASRQSNVLAIQSRIRLVRPDAIQIWGSVAMPATGQGAPDGHIENRSVIWGDVPYAFPDVPWSDAQNLVTNGLPTQLNIAGDGRGDRSYYTGFQPRVKAVARVSFAELRGVASSSFSTDCYSGPPVPALDEQKEFDVYLQRNLDYRNGKRPIERRSAFSYRPDMERTRPIYRAMVSWLEWYDHPAELHDPHVSARIWFGGTMPDAWWRSFLGCEPANVLWFVNFRSNAWEWFGYRNGLPRALTFGPLVAVWGNDDWKFGKFRTVAEDIAESWKAKTITGVPALMYVAGDLTLPYVDYPFKVEDLHVVSE